MNIQHLRIDPASAEPPYAQVRSRIAERIGDGSLPAGTQLPTVRGLATELGLAANTVARAYRELEEVGLIETRGRRGSVVSAGDARTQRAVDAATEYARAVRALGLDHREALGIARAVLEAQAETH